MSAKKKSVKNSKDVLEKFPAPDIESLRLDENFVFESAMKNDYTTICGALDAKDHPLTAFLVEKNLMNKRDEFGKSVFDLAACLGNKDFIRTILERVGDKLDETAFNLRALLKPSNSYNFMHFACIWGHLELCKYLIDNQKQIAEISAENGQNELSSSSTMTIQSNKGGQTATKSLGSVLLKARTKTGETPKDLAKRYNHFDLVDFLIFAEKRQSFVESINEIKMIDQSKLTKEDKKKLEKISSDILDWIDKNRDIDMATLESKIAETEELVKPILNRLTSSASNVAFTSPSKVQTPTIK